MNEVLLLLAGAVGGFFIHSVTMKVSFKQRTIDNKIKVYDALITQWVKIRNFIYAHHLDHPVGNFPNEIIRQFDQLYGESQQYIGETFLICDDSTLTTDINNFNERFYRAEWRRLPLERANEKMEELKKEAILVISRMREDVKASTRLEWEDITHIISGFRRKNANT